MPTREHAQAGFTLLEVVVALVIAAFSLAAIIPALSGALHRGAQDAMREQAAMLAGSTLDQVGSVIPLNDGTVVRTGGKFRWTLAIARWCPAGPDHCEAAGNAVAAHAVTVSVASADQPGIILARLDTLRLQAAPP
jgi:prepilin-type N-terminal cleavage/methylation domain-containing protein